MKHLTYLFIFLVFITACADKSVESFKKEVFIGDENGYNLKIEVLLSGMPDADKAHTMHDAISQKLYFRKGDEILKTHEITYNGKKDFIIPAVQIVSVNDSLYYNIRMQRLPFKESKYCLYTTNGQLVAEELIGNQNKKTFLDSELEYHYNNTLVIRDMQSFPLLYTD